MNTDATRTVVVVDDDPATCYALAQVLEGQGYRVATFTSALEYLNSNVHRPDCVIADVRMPEVDGVTMYEAARAAGREAPTVFITGALDMSAAVAALRPGASDVLQKPVMIPTLRAAVAAAASESAARREATASLRRHWRAIATLTPREAEVCGHVARGRLNKQIAALIGTREKTVKVHRANALKKLGASSVAQLVHMLDALISEMEQHHPADDDGQPIPVPDSLQVIRRLLAGEDEPAR
jgi:FixJ family two-component response regulator